MFTENVWKMWNVSFEVGQHEKLDKESSRGSKMKWKRAHNHGLGDVYTRRFRAEEANSGEKLSSSSWTHGWLFLASVLGFFKSFEIARELKRARTILDAVKLRGERVRETEREGGWLRGIPALKWYRRCFRDHLSDSLPLSDHLSLSLSILHSLSLSFRLFFSLSSSLTSCSLSSILSLSPSLSGSSKNSCEFYSFVSRFIPSFPLFLSLSLSPSFSLSVFARELLADYWTLDSTFGYSFARDFKYESNKHPVVSTN